MMKIRLLNRLGAVLGDAEIEPPTDGLPPDVVTFAGLSYVPRPVGFEEPLLAAIYRPATTCHVGAVRKPDSPVAAKIETTRTGARMTLDAGETSAGDAAALAAAARGRG